MRFCFLTLLSLPLVLFAACEKPCPKGQQRYGVKCVKSPVPDSGVDAEDGGTDARGNLDGGAGDDPLASCVPPKCHPCEMEPCQNAGICSETDTGFECACKVGFSGKVCAVDACVIDPCVHGECTRKANARSCKCDLGYVGDACETNTNAALASLRVSTGSLYPSFSPSVYKYSVDLGISSPEITLTASAAIPDGSRVRMDGLPEGAGAVTGLFGLMLNTSKEVTIEVEADDGSKLHYQVTIRRSLVQGAYLKRRSPAATDYFGGTGESLSFNKSVGLSGGVLAVGGAHVWSNSGIVQTFARASGGWRHLGDETMGQRVEIQLGYSIAVSPRWIVASAPNEARAPGTPANVPGAGALYVFERTASGITGPTKLVEPDPVADGGLGLRVAVSDDSIAAISWGKGVAYVFRRGDKGWQDEPIAIKKPKSTPGMFGPDIAIEGDIVVVGGADRDSNAGAAFVYDISTGVPEQIGYLTHPTLGFMGVAVAISNGRIAVAGGGSAALVARQIVVYRRERGEWTAGEPFGLEGSAPDFLFGAYGMAFQANRILVGAPTQSGYAYLFTEGAGGWYQDALLELPMPVDGGRFGMGVAMDGNTIAISAPGDSSAADASGAVYVFSIDCSKVPTGAAVPEC